MKTLNQKDKDIDVTFNNLNEDLKVKISYIYLEILKNEVEILSKHFNQIDNVISKLKIKDKDIKEKISFDIINGVFLSLLINHNYINDYKLSEKVKFIINNIKEK